MSLSKVKSVQATGSFENDYGTVQDNTDLPKHGKKLLYKFEYEFEDGVILTANHKTIECPFKPGDEIEYNVTKTHPEYGKSGKVTKPDTGNYGGSSGKPMDNTTQLQIVRQNALGHAVAILIHNASKSSIVDGTPVSHNVDPIEVIEIAERFAKYVQSPADTQNATEALMDDSQN